MKVYSWVIIRDEARILNQILFLFFVTNSEGTDCPTLTTVEGFDIEAYTDGTWYVQQQAETTYLRADRNFCVTADYTIRDEPTWPWGYTIDVNNRAEDINGNEFGGKIFARQDGSDDPAKLKVVPGFLPPLFAGPYWIIAYEEGENGYALVSGGQPTIRTENGCKTGNNVFTSSGGLWILTRKSQRDDDLVEAVRTMAKGFELDLTILNDVKQDNCNY